VWFFLTSARKNLAMRKIQILLFTAIVLLFTQNAIAQETSVGLRGGLNFANLSGSDISGEEAQFKYHAGAFVQIRVTDFFALQVEGMYSLKGSETSLGDIDLTYIDVPILAKLYLSDRFNIHAGPQFGVLIDAENESAGVTTDIDDRFSTLELGAAAGIEYHLEMGIHFGARYQFSLNSIGEDYEQTTTIGNVTTTTKIDEPDIKNGIIQAYIGFNF
jgi:hypothetical protein